jgi:RNA polymerase sigma factor (sigma-70 family)
MTDANPLHAARSRVRLRLASDEKLVALIRRGDIAAFEALYERRSRELLSFCVYMLGSRQDAEDALQSTFASAYRALRADEREILLRPWLFAIARNECLTVLRARRPTVELNGEPALTGDPWRELELREEIRHMVSDLRKLPERQRSALVLAEMHGLSQHEIGTVLGVRATQVKSYVYQARSSLLSERRAREADCRAIREELATARGAALLRGRLRRHVRSCEDCRVYADGVARQRRQLAAALLPFVPSLGLRYRALRDILGSGAAEPASYAGGAAVGGSVAAGAAVEVAGGGGVGAVAGKLAAGLACLCASAGVGASVLGVTPGVPLEQVGLDSSSHTSAATHLVAAVGPAGMSESGSVGPVATTAPATNPAGTNVGDPPGQPSGAAVQSAPLPASGGNTPSSAPPGAVTPDGAREGDTRGEEAVKSREHTPQSAEERRLQEEERRLKTDEHQLKSEEHKLRERERQRKLEEDPPKSEEERQLQHEERQLEAEQRERAREEREQRRGHSRPPPKTKEEREKLREEREQRHGGSRPPKSEEERLQHRREREERKAEQTPAEAG